MIGESGNPRTQGRNDFEGLSKTRAKGIVDALKRPATRNGGIMIYNWALNTARQEGDVDLSNNNADINQDGVDRNIFKFQDFFTSEERAKEGWNKTLWAKLGFSYDNLQNENGWEETHYYNQKVDGVLDANWVADNDLEHNDFKLYGKTTDANIDISLSTTVSSLNSGKGYNNDPTKRNTVNDDNITPRTYGNVDVSTPVLRKGQVQPNVLIHQVGQPTDTSNNNDNDYISSDYNLTATYNVATTSNSITASGFPTLSTRGYFLITSDIVDNIVDDVKQSNAMGLLGVVPISNLSNQDFITTKNTITHTLQQQKILNNIKIRILNPNLTNPLLEENSSVLIQIDTPIQQEQLAIQNPNTEQETNTEGDKKEKQTDKMKKDEKKN